ncbi:MAG: endonuclease domain-containing protein [Bacteroidetes bacterium]|nr:MAG: endonuclease domain-containing protein [Bacteroidota bacterium]
MLNRQGKRNLEIARDYRKKMTNAERIFWLNVRDNRFLNLKFRRQEPIGSYIVDFVCLEKELVIEIDGGVHKEINQIEYDKVRTQYLQNLGFKVLRFWNNEIENNINKVLNVIKDNL